MYDRTVVASELVPRRRLLDRVHKECAVITTDFVGHYYTIVIATEKPSGGRTSRLISSPRTLFPAMKPESRVSMNIKLVLAEGWLITRKLKRRSEKKKMNVRGKRHPYRTGLSSKSGNLFGVIHHRSY
jgi:hypothetical protein